MSAILDLWKYRSLIGALTVRHLSMRYRGSVLGFLWSFLNPLCLMAVYTIVFRFYIRFNEVENYTIFLFCGLLPWIWMTSGLIEGTNAVVSSGHLITKSMFPAHILPATSVLTSLVNFLLSLPLLFLFMWIAGVPIPYTIIFLPLLVLIQTVFLFGITLGLSALNVHYRDVQHVVGNLLTFLFFLCPILYPPEVVPEKFRFTLSLNPFAVFTTLYHDLILGGVLPSITAISFAVLSSVIVLVIGLVLFDRYRESFAELL